MRIYAGLIFLSVVVFTQQIEAQGRMNDPANSFLVFGSISVPRGDFGRDVGSAAYITRRNGYYFGDLVGLAKNGWGVGAEVYLPIRSLRGADWVFSGQLLISSPNISAIKDIFQTDVGDSLSLAIDLSDWINFPIMTGMRYRQDLMDDASLYAVLQGGINISKEPNRRITVSGNVAEDTKFNSYLGFGFEAGVGVILFNRYNLSVRYLNLGTPSFTGTRTLSPEYFPTIVTRESKILGDQRKVEMFQIILGIEL